MGFVDSQHQGLPRADLRGDFLADATQFADLADDTARADESAGALTSDESTVTFEAIERLP